LFPFNAHDQFTALGGAHTPWVDPLEDTADLSEDTLETSIGSFVNLEKEETLLEKEKEQEKDINISVPVREKPISATEWQSYFDKEGRITDIDKLKHRIFYGGVTSEIRAEVWKFLLGCYSFQSTYTERNALKEKKRYLSFEDTLHSLKRYSILTPQIGVCHLQRTMAKHYSRTRSPFQKISWTSSSNQYSPSTLSYYIYIAFCNQKTFR
jgi:hypothetical protein